MDEQERGLIERARSDPEAFGLLYDRHVAGIYRFVYARVGNAAAAEDVTAEVFINALRAIDRYRDLGRPFSLALPDREQRRRLPFPPRAGQPGVDRVGARCRRPGRPDGPPPPRDRVGLASGRSAS